MEENEKMENLPVSSSEADIKQRGIKELFLDTKGACFLCLKEAVKTENRSDDDNYTLTHNHGGMTEVCLRNVCRYLNINPCSILWKSLYGSLEQNEEDAAVQNDKCDFSVLLCTTCSSHTNQLSKLIRQVELAKMMIDHHLQVFDRILKESDEYDEEVGTYEHPWKKVEDKMLSVNGSSVEVSLVENLRKEAKRKCSLKIKHLEDIRLPKLQLKRLKIKSPENSLVTSEHDLATNHDKDEVNLFPPSPTTVVSIPPPVLEEQMEIPVEFGTEDNSRIKKVLPTRKKCASTTKQLMSIVLTKFCEKYNCGNGFWYRCLSCKRFTNPYPKATVLLHFVNRHPEKFFSHTMPQNQNLSDAVFKSYCAQALVSQVKDAQIKSGFTKRSRNRGCSKVRCHLCGYNCSGSNYLKKHLLLEHYKVIEQKLTTLCNIRTVGNGNDASVCDDNSQSKTQFLIKRSRGRPLKMRFTRVNIRQLPIRKNSKRNTTIKEPEKESTSSVTNEIKQTSSTIDTKDIITDICGNYIYINAHQFECRICRKVFIKGSYRRHLLTVHPEIFFTSNARLSHISEMTFRKLCRQVISSEAGKAVVYDDSTNLISVTMSCLFCNRKFCGSSNLKCHFIQEHFNILKEKILQCQKSENTVSHKNVKRINMNVSNSKDQNPLPAIVSSVNELKLWAVKKYCKQIEEQSGKVSESVNRYHRCVLCNKFKGLYHKSALFSHLVRIHPEKVFAHAKLKRVSSQKFRACCWQVLQPGSIGNVKLPGFSRDCSHCSYRNTEKLVQAQQLQLNSVTSRIRIRKERKRPRKFIFSKANHYESKTEQCLNEMQQNSTEERKEISKDEALTAVAEKKTSKNKNGFTQMNSQSKARLFQILHKRWRMKKLKGLSKNLARNQITATCTPPCNRNIGEKSKEPSNKSDARKADKSFKTVETSSSTIPCQQTSTTTANCQRKKIPYSSDLKRRRKDSQPKSLTVSNSFSQNVSINASFKSATQLISDICNNHLVKVGREYHYTCPFCNLSTQGKFMFKIHLTNSHPEMLLSDFKKPDVSDLNFKINCKSILKAESAHAIQQQKQSLSLKSKKVQIPCLHCHQLFRLPRYLRAHLVTEHSNVFKDKLMHCIG